MSPPPPPQRLCYSPPALVDDAMREIFNRVPPDDPRTLVRAAAVCTSWHGVLSDANFTREYRAFHRAPPMLGFLLNTRHGKLLGKRASIHHQGKTHLVSSFVSTASFRPPACHDRRHRRVLDSRHGLVLFHTPKRDEDFVVCDLVTYDRWGIKAGPDCGRIIWNGHYDEEEDEEEWSFATVLEPKLYLWSMEIGPNGAVTWAQRRAIELEPLLPSGALFDVSVVGFAEGVGVIFLSTKAGLYTIELSSGRCKKVHRKTSIRKVMPYMSFYTRAWGPMSISH